jgi:hypothetical protein
VEIFFLERVLQVPRITNASAFQFISFPPFFLILFFGNILNVYQFMQIFSKKKKSIHAEVFGIFALLQKKLRKYETLKSSEKAVIVLSIS